MDVQPPPCRATLPREVLVMVRALPRWTGEPEMQPVTPFRENGVDS